MGCGSSQRTESTSHGYSRGPGPRACIRRMVARPSSSGSTASATAWDLRRVPAEGTCGGYRWGSPPGAQREIPAACRPPEGTCGLCRPAEGAPAAKSGGVRQPRGSPPEALRPKYLRVWRPPDGTCGSDALRMVPAAGRVVWGEAAHRGMAPPLSGDSLASAA